MPLYKKIELPEAVIGIWQLTEDISFFEHKFPAIDIPNENKRLQFYATRNLANELSGKPCEVVKDDLGKPYLRDGSHHISISHTSSFATVILSVDHAVGIDLETINPKVERIAHKFLTSDELKAIQPKEWIKKLIVYWSAKESMFKFYGKGKIEFKTQLLIEPFELKEKGTLKAEILTPEITLSNLHVQYQFFEGHILTYVTGL